MLAEVCIVGGGLAGLNAALELARAGRTVAVLEARRVAWGASGRNGGFVSPAWSAGHNLIAARAGPDAAKSLHRLSIEGAEMVRENLAVLGVEGAAVVPGLISVARFEQTRVLEAERDWLEREFAYPTEVWTRERVREALRSDCYHQGLYKPRAFHLDPLTYSRALMAEIERLGGMIYEESPASGLERRAGGWRVATAAGAVTASDVLLATGGYTGKLDGRLHRAFLPVATYVMLTAADPELIATAVRTPLAVGDQRRAGDYYRLVDDGRRLLWGGKITTSTAEPRRLAELIRRAMAATYPQLAGLEVELAWSGLMAYARHLMPQVGPIEPGLWCCTAFGGHGLNTTAIGGRVVAEAIAGASDRWRLFAPFRLTWNGGLVGKAAVQATYWALQAQDAWNERVSSRTA